MTICDSYEGFSVEVSPLLLSEYSDDEGEADDAVHVYGEFLGVDSDDESNDSVAEPIAVDNYCPPPCELKMHNTDRFSRFFNLI